MRIAPIGFSSYQNFIGGTQGVQGAQAVDNAEASKPVVNPG